MKSKHLFVMLALAGALPVAAQCIANPANIYHFQVNNFAYEIVKENKSWVDASACAVARGGMLAQIETKAEQDTLFYHLNHAGILAANTKAPDGGNASYVWLGGNDISSEGHWVWDGINATSFNQFWQGNAAGSAVNGAYTNWGNEPDNWNSQNGLGLAVTNWPLGMAGQWNDVKETNLLYYIIEYPFMITTSVPELQTAAFSVYPNPAEDRLVIKTSANQDYSLINTNGSTVLKGRLTNSETEISLTSLESGMYIVLSGGQITKFVKR